MLINWTWVERGREEIGMILRFFVLVMGGMVLLFIGVVNIVGGIDLGEEIRNLVLDILSLRYLLYI